MPLRDAGNTCQLASTAADLDGALPIDAAPGQGAAVLEPLAVRDPAVNKPPGVQLKSAPLDQTNDLSSNNLGAYGGY